MWDYNDKVMEHFLHPHNVGEIENADAIGEVGNISCGDALKLFLKLDDDGKICDVKFQTYGCASAIASSSALTDLVQGMTLDEAAEVTNRDIVDLLGELPEEKMHCSVMGMEALQAAIANYRGETLEEDENHEGRIVCHCFGVTDAKIRHIAKENKLTEAEDVTNYCKAGGACGSCLDDIQEILDGIWHKPHVIEEENKSGFAALPLVQKVIKVQQVIDNEIKPILEQDGGSIELINVDGTNVLVELKGRCASCPTASVTLKHVVQDKLREFVAPELTVESV
jgi:NifU-like protein